MRRLWVSGLLAVSAVSFAGIGVTRAADPVAQFKAVTITEAPRGVAVAIETSGPLRYQTSVIEAPYRIVIDMAGVYAAGKARWVPAPEPVKEIRGSQWKPGTARLVVELTQPVKYKIDEGATGLTLTIEASGEGRAESPRPDRAAKAEAAKSDVSLPALPKWRASKPDPGAAKQPSSDPRIELATLSSAKVEPVRNEPARVEVAKLEPVKPETAKTEPV